MGFANIKTKNQGFTIVELLIVVVVIAILAAITIVSYNGITTKANASAADSLVATWRKKVELYQAEEGRYPVSISTDLNNSAKSYYITNTNATSAALSGTNGTERVQVLACGPAAPTAANVTGIRIVYWDYDATTPVATNVNIGTGATCANLTGVRTD